MKRCFIIICMMMFLMSSCEGALSSQGIASGNGVTVWRLMYDIGTNSTAQYSSGAGNTKKSKQAVKPKDFNTKAIREITGNTVFEASTNLKSYQVGDGLLVLAVSPSQKVSLRKLNLKGKVIWVKNLEQKGYSTTEIIMLNNGNVVFGVSDWPNTSMGTPSDKDGKLYCFNQVGRQQWTYTYKDKIGCRIKYIFQDKLGELLCVGLNNQGDPLKDESDVVITRISNNGEFLEEAYFGGSHGEYCEGAAYDKNLGLVFTGWSLSRDGEFAIDTATKYTDYVACVDETLKLKWIHKPEESIRYRYDQIHIYEGLIGLCGMHISNDTPINTTMYAHVINGEGKLIQETKVEQARYPEGTMCITDDQKIVFAYNVEKGSKILIKNLQGKILNELSINLTNVDQVIPVSGGGFIVKYTYSVGGIPQPVHSSSRPMDTATTLSCYDENCQLLWQKTYDDYLVHKQTDYVYIKK